MDNSSIGAGFMVVFAVSGSVALLALQLHKRALSEFMDKFECELGGSNKNLPKKKVRFSDDVHCKKYVPGSIDEKDFQTMPLNRQALYKGIIQFKGFKGDYYT